ncbi:hypothetical protein GQ44DRAFT_719316 [Phaeosphaeriaceae sp. PMI808]|nr:hypothetical protein GQ44DRAFT_719316 [Phaeosphaeriaceae sp. PMI808]
MPYLCRTIALQFLRVTSVSAPTKRVTVRSSKLARCATTSFEVTNYFLVTISARDRTIYNSSFHLTL